MINLRFFALRRATALSLTVLLAFAVAACTSDSGTSSAPAASGGGTGGGGSGTATVSGGTVEITAADLKFDASTIEAPAGEAWTISFTNNDSQPHNISVYAEEGGETIVEGEVINEGQTVEVEVPALDAGDYYFQCDIHTDMNGTVSVS